MRLMRLDVARGRPRTHCYRGSAAFSHTAPSAAHRRGTSAQGNSRAPLGARFEKVLLLYFFLVGFSRVSFPLSPPRPSLRLGRLWCFRTRTMVVSWRAVFVCLLSLVLGASCYDVVREYSGQSFFDRWDFYGSWDNLTLGELNRTK